MNGIGNASFCHVLTGADIASGPVWMEYISFLKSLPVCVTLPYISFAALASDSFYYILLTLL